MFAAMASSGRLHSVSAFDEATDAREVKLPGWLPGCLGRSVRKSRPRAEETQRDPPDHDTDNFWPLVHRFRISARCWNRLAQCPVLVRRRGDRSLLRGIHFSVSAAVGFVPLFGVAVMGGLLYIAEIKRRRTEPGVPLEQAVVEGAKAQARPLLLLIFVALLGMIPAATATGIGSDVQRPLATVTSIDS